MNKITRTALFILLQVLCLSQLTLAQGIGKKREYSGFFDSYYYRGPLAITAGGGLTLYKGDLAKGFYGSPGMAFSVGANYKVWPRIVFGGEFQYFTLAGSLNTDTSSSSFKGTNLGLNLYGRFYLTEDIIRKAQDRKGNKKLKFFILGGVSFIKYTATATPAGTSGGITPVFPVGLGFQYGISQKLQIGAEFTHAFTLTDKLDAVSGKGKDGYGMLQLKVQYAPWAPRKKAKAVSSPAEPNQHREEHQEWRKKKDPPPPPPSEELPGEEQPTEENPENPEGTEQPTEEQPAEEQPSEEWK